MSFSLCLYYKNLHLFCQSDYVMSIFIMTFISSPWFRFLSRIKQLVEEKTTPKNRDEQEIVGYRDVLNIIHEDIPPDLQKGHPMTCKIFSSVPTVFRHKNRQSPL